MRSSLAAAGVLAGLLTASGVAFAGNPMSRYYADDTQGIFWFMHISDLHIDTGAAGPTNNLEFALGEAVQVINPIAVFASGDLVNGTILGVPTSGQDQNEWNIYKSIYSSANLPPTFYFDMPGNHDGYGDHGLTHYLKNSEQGQATNDLFSDTTYTTALGDYYFVDMNSAGTYDTPFTFGNPAFTNVDELVAGLAAHKSAQLVFVFAHHHLVPHGNTDAQTKLGIGGTDNPPSNVGTVVPLLESAGAFYLHGHVHQYKESMEGNIVTEQIGKLGGTPAVDRSSIDAWDHTKYETNIGVGIVDHNAFVYRTTDTTDPWPFVAITAPVDINLQGGGVPAGTQAGIPYSGDYLAYGAEKNPYAYDVCGPNTANPVRALVLSGKPITSVSVMFDSSNMGQMTAATTPKGIYTTTVDTSQAKPGVHSLTVTAVSGGESRSDSIEINVTAGPCQPFGDAGADAGAGVDAGGDAAPAAEAGNDAAPTGDAGAQEAAPGGDAGAQDAYAGDAAGSNGAPPQNGSDTGGCSCSMPGHAPGSALGGLAWLGALALVRRRRRRAS